MDPLDIFDLPNHTPNNKEDYRNMLYKLKFESNNGVEIIYAPSLPPPPQKNLGNSISKILKPCFIVMMLFGQFPFKVVTQGKKKLDFTLKSIAACYCITFHLVAIFRLMQYSASKANWMSRIPVNLDFFIFAGQGLVYTMGNAIVTVDIFLRRKAFLDFWGKLENLFEDSFAAGDAKGEHQFTKQLRSNCKKLLVAFFVLDSLCITMLWNMFLMKDVDIISAVFIFLNNFSTTFYLLQTVVVTMCLNIIRMFFQKLNNDLKCLLEKTSGGLSEALDDNKEEFIRFVDSYEKNLELVKDANRCFSLRLFVQIVGFMYSIVAVVYFFIFSFADGADKTFVGVARSQVPIALLCSFLLYALCHTCHAIQDEALKLGDVASVRHLLTKNCQPLQNGIQLLMTKIAASPPVISPGGFYTLNRGLITSIAATGTTYFIVLAQFKKA